MYNSQNQPGTSGKTLREQYVPHEERESQKLNWKPFVWETAKFFIVTKLAAIAGTIIGEHAFKMPTVKLAKFARYNHGTQIGALAGATYELYQHWRKTTGQQLGVKSISSDLRTAIDPAQLEKETQKEVAILEGIAKIQELHAAQKISHGESILARRDAQENASIER